MSATEKHEPLGATSGQEAATTRVPTTKQFTTVPVGSTTATTHHVEEEEEKTLPERASAMAHDFTTDVSAVPRRMFKSMIDTLRKPFAGSSTVQKLKENLFSAPHFALLGQEFPDFEAKSTRGTVKLHTYFAQGWGVVITHPQAFDPISLTELTKFASMIPEFDRRKCKLCAISTGAIESHLEWTPDLVWFGKGTDTATSGSSSTVDSEVFDIPIMPDMERAMAHRLGTLDGTAEDTHSGEPLMARAVFIIGPDRKLRYSQIYPDTCGRSVQETLRILDALQRTENRLISTPGTWIPGKPCLVNADANLKVKDVLFPQGVAELKLKHMTLNTTPDPETEDRTLLHYVIPLKPQHHAVSSLNLGDELPNFNMTLTGGIPLATTRNTTMAQDDLRTYLNRDWGVVCTLGDPFSPLCLVELAEVLDCMQDFNTRDCKLVFLTSQPLARDLIDDAMEYAKCGTLSSLPFALVLDEEREIIAGLGAVDEKVRGADGMSTVARGVYIVGNGLKLRASMIFPCNVGRNWQEVLRVVDSLKLTDSTVGIFTPEGWFPGQECVVDAQLTSDQFDAFFPGSMVRTVPMRTKRLYFRYVKDPTNITSVH